MDKMKLHTARLSPGRSPRWMQFLPLAIRLLACTLVLNFLVFAPQIARAQSALEPTQIVVGAPAQATLGVPLTVQALLADSQGHPISQAVIYFTAPTKFLSASSDVVLAQAVTDGKGQAVAEVSDDSSATVTLHAEFRGDAQYAPSDATVQISAAGDAQVYAEHVGVDLPGFNVPPMGAPEASLQSPQQGIAGFVQSLWPAMNGWPVAAVLLLVWSMYLFAVRFVFRVARLADEPEESPSTDSGRSL